MHDIIYDNEHYAHNLREVTIYQILSQLVFFINVVLDLSNEMLNIKNVKMVSWKWQKKKSSLSSLKTGQIYDKITKANKKHG